jgi:hypothetical protein
MATTASSGIDIRGIEQQLIQVTRCYKKVESYAVINPFTLSRVELKKVKILPFQDL